MITIDKIKIYSRYHGDIDSWARSGSKKEKSIISDKDWHEIDSLVHDLYLLDKGLTSSEFSNVLDHKLREGCDGKETVLYLKKLASKR